MSQINFDSIINKAIEKLDSRDERVKVILKLNPSELKEIALLLNKLREKKGE